MEHLAWTNMIRVDVARRYFDNYVTAWNPRDAHHSNISIHRPPEEDPCLLDTSEIFNIDHLDDYEQLANRVQCHTRCSVHSCLRKKGSSYMCRYNAPWELQDQSKIFVNDKGHKKYEPTRNNDRLNFHNIPLLSIWCANVDCQLVLSRHAVLKYIAKYASKSE